MPVPLIKAYHIGNFRFNAGTSVPRTERPRRNFVNICVVSP